MTRPKKPRTRGKSQKKYTVLCDWCGDRVETSRQDTKTCGTRCRARLSFYVRTLGYPPDGIVGPFTGQDAVDLELHRLVIQEQRRRAAVAAERKAYLARPGA